MKKIIISIIFIICGCAHSKDRFVSSNSDTNLLNEGVADISNPTTFSKIYVISDVHGMYDNLVKLLQAGKIIDKENNWIAKNSLLIVTGDSIDKGTKSIEVLDLWIKLQNQSAIVDGRLIHVLGNHEAEFLANPETTNKKSLELIKEMQELKIPLSDLTTEDSPRGKFIHSEPLALKVGNWIFCHSGLLPMDANWIQFSENANRILNKQDYSNDFLIGENSILEAKKWELDLKIVNQLISYLNSNSIFGIVFGHQPGAFDIHGRSAAKYNGRLIKIDNGMAPEAGAHSGSILVFNKPEEMLLKNFPQIGVISSDGVVSLLNIE